MYSIQESRYTTSDCSGSPTQTRSVQQGECANPTEGVGQTLETCVPGGVADTRIYPNAECTGDTFTPFQFTADGSCISLDTPDESGNVAYMMDCIQTESSAGAGVGIGIGALGVLAVL